MRISDRIAQELKRAWTASQPLTAVCLLMLAAFVASLAGLVTDHRTITGVPAWLKPAKFAISTAIFTGTLAWLYRFIHVWPRLLRALAWIVSMLITLEVVLIDMQAARGTTSHFNNTTSFDTAVFSIMGIAIGAIWLANIGILAALFKQKFQNPVLGWALRLGMLITILGSASGGLMLRPTHQQTEAIRAGHRVTTFGGHTVGAPDGGPGVKGVGWSSQHGDLRIPHFFGLHGMQIVPLLYWLLLQKRGLAGNPSGVRSVFTIAISYFALVVILAWQALRGESILQPDAKTVALMSVWLAATAATPILFRVSSERVVSRTAREVL